MQALTTYDPQRKIYVLIQTEYLQGIAVGQPM